MIYQEESEENPKGKTICIFNESIGRKKNVVKTVEDEIFRLSSEIGKKGNEKIEYSNQGKRKRNLSVRAENHPAHLT